MPSNAIIPGRLTATALPASLPLLPTTRPATLAINGTSYEIKNGQTLSIGRGPKNTLQIDDKRVSRRHTEIEFDKGRAVLHAFSRFGTFVWTGNWLRLSQEKLYMNPAETKILTLGDACVRICLSGDCKYLDLQQVGKKPGNETGGKTGPKGARFEIIEPILERTVITCEPMEPSHPYYHEFIVEGALRTHAQIEFQLSPDRVGSYSALIQLFKWQREWSKISETKLLPPGLHILQLGRNMEDDPELILEITVPC